MSKKNTNTNTKKRPNHHRSKDTCTPSAPTSWDPVARWYAQWTGTKGSKYHRTIAIPTLLDLLQPAPRDTIIDIGCGTGILVPSLPDTVQYIGIDASPRLLATAKRRHGKGNTFLQGDAARLSEYKDLKPGIADAAVFLLSIQDMEPLQQILDNASWVLKRTGRLVILMFHPCFRVPRQSGWGWDDGRSLQYRRVDSYLSPRAVPVRPIAKGKPGSIMAYHAPLEAYVNGLVVAGLSVNRIVEVPAYPGIVRHGRRARAENRANREIPLFLAIRAEKTR